MKQSTYNDFKLYKKDRKSAKLEIKELEILLEQAKSQYKHVFQEEYDNNWYTYIKNALNWLNPIYYIQSKMNFDLAYYIYADNNYYSNYDEGYDMYSSVYEDIDSDFEISDDECNMLD